MRRAGVLALSLLLMAGTGSGFAAFEANASGFKAGGLAARRNAATSALNKASPAYRQVKEGAAALSAAASAPTATDAYQAMSQASAPPVYPDAALTAGRMAPPPAGRLYLFAAVRGRSYGVDFLQDVDGAPYSAFSAARIAQVGDAQVGLGWRSGPHQTSIGLLVRRQRYHDPFLDRIAPHRDQVIAITYSLRPEPPARKTSAEPTPE